MEIAVGEFVFDALVAGPPGGPLVLLLHGFPQCSYQWRHQLPLLAGAGYRAVAPDQRGYSPRARPEDVADYHVDRLVEDAVGMGEALGAEQFHIIGHDWGGMVAWAVAARHPARVRSLTAVSTPHPLAMAQALGSPTGDQAARSRYVALFQLPAVPERLLLVSECAGLRALFANTAYTDKEAVDEYVAQLCDPATLTAVLNWYRAIDIKSLAGIGPISRPTLYVWSTDDPALGREAAESTAAHVSGPYQFVVLDGVSHWVPEDTAEDLNRVLLAHLRAVDASAQ